MMAESKSDLMMKYGPNCICPKCPSYNKCAQFRSQRSFCIAGKSPSDCIKNEKGCVCGDCPVGQELGKKEQYYCRYDR